MDYSKEVNNLKNKLDDAKLKRAKAETTLESLNKQKDDILKEIEKLGIKPENLDIEIKNLESEIEGLLFEASKLLSEDL